MEREIILKLFSEGNFSIDRDKVEWINNLAYGLINYYESTNLANNVNDIEFYENVVLSVEEEYVGISIGATGNNGTNLLYITLDASVNDDFKTLSNCDYSSDEGEEIEDDYNDDDEDWDDENGE